jgi:hypothetical protein
MQSSEIVTGGIRTPVFFFPEKTALCVPDGGLADEF